MKTPNSSNFEEKIEKELKSLQDSVMNTSEPYIYQEDFDIERKESLRAISTLCEEEKTKARIDELMHIATDTNDEPCICYFVEDGNCDRDMTIEDRIKELENE